MGVSRQRMDEAQLQLGQGHETVWQMALGHPSPTLLVEPESSAEALLKPWSPQGPPVGMTCSFLDLFWGCIPQNPPHFLPHSVAFASSQWTLRAAGRTSYYSLDVLCAQILLC